MYHREKGVEMSVTEVTRESWFSRIGNAFKGLILGLIFVVGAVVLLFWNEGRAVHRYKALTEGARNVVSIQADRVDPANEGQLVCISGQAVTDVQLKDETFNVVVNALKLRRTVEMYQWVQQEERKTKRNTGGSTETTVTYNYVKQWSNVPIPSDQFKQSKGHENPAAMPWSSQEQTASPITLGGFTLSPSLVDKINTYVPYSPEKTVPVKPIVPASPDTEKPEVAKTDSAKTEVAKTDDVKTETVKAATTSELKPYNDGFYQGKDPAHPEIGDVRVTFEVVKPQDVTCVSVQKGNTFIPYQAKTGTVELLESGIVASEEMFAHAQSANKILTWILRIVGLIVCFLGFTMLFQPLPVLADVLPFFGRLVEAGTTILSFLLAAMTSFITIGVAWFFYRPLLSVPLFAGAIILMFLFCKRIGKRRGKG